LRDLFRCLVLVVLMPFALLLVGPLLLLGAARGRQPAGPVTLRPARGDWSGRLATGLVGVVLWVATWGGMILLTWPTIERTLISQTATVAPEALVSPLPSPPPAQPGLQVSVASATPEPTPRATVTPRVSDTVPSMVAATETSAVGGWTSTPTVPPPSVEVPAATVSPTPASSPTMTRVPTLTLTPVPTPTRTSTPTPTLVPTPVPSATLRPTPVPAPTAMPTPSATPSPPPPPTTTATPSLTPTEVGEQMALAMSAVEMANEMLRLAIETPTSEVLAALEQLWKDRSLGKAQTFAVGMYYRVGKPVKASYVYLVPPRVTHEPTQNLMLVDAIEVWTYEGSILEYVEAFQFNYTLAQRDGRWLIVDYWYRNAPTAEPPHTY
jgi:hypothetical protein